MTLEERIKNWKASGTEAPTFAELTDPLFRKGVLYGLELAMEDDKEKIIPVATDAITCIDCGAPVNLGH
jgi:hypothetical protein